MPKSIIPKSSKKGLNMIGLEADTTKIEVVSKHKGWCSLCRKRIYEGETVYTWENNEQFKVHTSCVDVQDRMNNTFFRQNVKKRNKRK